MNTDQVKKEQVMETVIKLMTLSKDHAATENERQVALDKATMLMTKYGIQTIQSKSKEQLSSTDSVEDTVIEMFYGHKGSHATWEILLGIACTKPFGVMFIKVDDTLHFFGMPEDLELSVYFFNYLQMEIDVQSHDLYPKHSSKRNSFGRGMANIIYERMMELYHRVQQATPSDCRALIVVKDKAVTERFNQKYPHTHTKKSSARMDNDAYRKGVIAGQQVDLS